MVVVKSSVKESASSYIYKRYLCKKHEGVFRACSCSCVGVVYSLVVLEPHHLLSILMMLIVMRIVWIM